MCSAANFWSTVFLVTLVGGLLAMAMRQQKFFRRLEENHPSLWRTLGARKVWTDDANTSYAAAQLYLLEGEYKSNPDESIVKDGDLARTSFFASLVGFVAWGAWSYLMNAWPSLSCLIGGSA